MLNIQVTSMDDAWAQDKLNTSLNTLEKRFSTYKAEETDQEYATFHFSGNVTKPYKCKVEKPAVEVPLTGVDECGNQYNVGRIKIDGSVEFWPINSIRHIESTCELEWQDPITNVYVATDFSPECCPGCCCFRINGDGPILPCSCLLWPNLMEDLNPKTLHEACFEYNYKWYYCGYPWVRNDGTIPSDYAGYYITDNGKVCVTLAQYNSSKLTCTYDTCVMHDKDVYTDQYGVCWCVVNEMSSCCVWETWQVIPQCDPYCETTTHYFYIPVCYNGQTYCMIRPIFWCVPGCVCHWAWAEPLCCWCCSTCCGSCWAVGGNYAWYEACSTLEHKDNECWNPNNTYFSGEDFDCFSMRAVHSNTCGTIFNPQGCVILTSGCNRYQDCILRNWARECFPDEYSPGAGGIYYNKEIYDCIKQMHRCCNKWRRTYKGGFISTVNHIVSATTCWSPDTNPQQFWAALPCWCCMCFGWIMPGDYMPLYATNVYFNVLYYSLNVEPTAYCISSDYVPCCNGYYVDYMCPACYIESPYCTEDFSPSACFGLACGTGASHFPCHICSNCWECGCGGICCAWNISRDWFNLACNNIYVPYSYCRTTVLYHVCQHCYGTATTTVSRNVHINVRYKKSRS